MAKKNKLPKPTLAESKTAIVFGVVFLLFCMAEVYAVYHLSSSRCKSAEEIRAAIIAKRWANLGSSK